jgi:hypothetical protein
MTGIFGYDTVTIEKSVLGERKGNLMLGLVFFILCLVPLEPNLRHRDSIVALIWL